MPRRKTVIDNPDEELTEILVDEIKEQKPVKQRRTRKTRSAVEQESFHEVLSLALGVVLLTINEAYRPTKDELDAILIPAERIIMRRYGIGEVSPDLQDVLYIMMGVMIYARRVGVFTQPGVRFQRSRRTATTTTNPVDIGKNSDSVQSSVSDEPTKLNTVDNALLSLYQRSYIPTTGEN